jgi:hypothetical protein
MFIEPMAKANFRVDKILQDIVERRCRLGRNADIGVKKAAYMKAVAELEISGDAMRYLNKRGEIAWKATPRLRDYLNDLKAGAEADLADEKI